MKTITERAQVAFVAAVTAGGIASIAAARLAHSYSVAHLPPMTDAQRTDYFDARYAEQEAHASMPREDAPHPLDHGAGTSLLGSIAALVLLAAILWLIGSSPSRKRATLAVIVGSLAIGAVTWLSNVYGF